MSFLDLAKARYSVRSFLPDPICKEHLDQILEAGWVAPTACNNQPQHIFVAKSPQALEKLASVCRCTFGAPTILVVCYDRQMDWKNKLNADFRSGETDAAIVCTHMMMEAFQLGVGSCWVGYFDPVQVARVLELPENLQVCALLPIGYPAPDAAPLPLHSSFRPLEETVTEI